MTPRLNPLLPALSSDIKHDEGTVIHTCRPGTGEPEKTSLARGSIIRKRKRWAIGSAVSPTRFATA
jgi:hypothetical protein